jgi:hypothetical protein
LSHTALAFAKRRLLQSEILGLFITAVRRLMKPGLGWLRDRQRQQEEEELLDHAASSSISRTVWTSIE